MPLSYYEKEWRSRSHHFLNSRLWRPEQVKLEANLHEAIPEGGLLWPWGIDSAWHAIHKVNVCVERHVTSLATQKKGDFYRVVYQPTKQHPIGWNVFFCQAGRMMVFVQHVSILPALSLRTQEHKNEWAVLWRVVDTQAVEIERLQKSVSFLETRILALERQHFAKGREVPETPK